MTYKGKVRNGVVVLEERMALPENDEVRVELTDDETSAEGRSWAEVFGDSIGSVRDLPPDMARNHDHYIHRLTD
jgi:hypothetical protein